jgi:hypothetical protein
MKYQSQSFGLEMKVVDQRVRTEIPQEMVIRRFTQRKSASGNGPLHFHSHALRKRERLLAAFSRPCLSISTIPDLIGFLQPRGC